MLRAEVNAYRHWNYLVEEEDFLSLVDFQLAVLLVCVPVAPNWQSLLVCSTLPNVEIPLETANPA